LPTTRQATWVMWIKIYYRFSPALSTELPGLWPKELDRTVTDYTVCTEQCWKCSNERNGELRGIWNSTETRMGFTNRRRNTAFRENESPYLYWNRTHDRRRVEAPSLLSGVFDDSGLLNPFLDSSETRLFFARFCPVRSALRSGCWGFCWFIGWSVPASNGVYRFAVKLHCPRAVLHTLSPSSLAFMTPLLGLPSSKSFITYMKVQKPRVKYIVATFVKPATMKKALVRRQPRSLIFESTNPGFVSAAFYFRPKLRVSESFI
jgi:hypothetical protein